MTIWMSNKGRNKTNYTEPKSYNRNHNNFGYIRDKAPESCLICGKSLNTSEKRLCKSCYGFIRKQNSGNTEKESY